MKTDRFPDDDVLPREQHPVEQKLEREGGVFLEPETTRLGCDADEEPCAPDEFFEDPYADDVTGVPGTVDDIPMTFGVQLPIAGDEHLVLEGATHPGGNPAPDEEPEIEISKRDEHELWAEQKPLIAEDTRAGLRLENFPEGRIPEILEAMGDDAAEALPDAPDGTSATGAGNAPEHGGFPERKD